MEFADAVAQMGRKVESLKDSITTEEATKNAFIMPFIGSVLGYDVFNPNEVIPEFTADVGVKRGEKVDYALVLDGQVQIIIECKKIGTQLSLENASQLYRYFACTHARIGVLTNGQVWNFYMDLDEPNKMDSKPFLVLDLMDIDKLTLPELQKLTKPSFDIESIASSAEELKYVGALKRAVAEQFREPSDEFVKLLASSVYDGAFRQAVVAKFHPLVEKALRRFLNDQVNDRLTTALGSEDQDAAGDGAPAAPSREDEPEVPDNGIVTTDEEVDAYSIVKAIACSEVDPSRVTMRDAKSYCAVFLDDNNRRPIARLYFNTRQKHFSVFDGKHESEHYPIDGVDEIYSHADEIRRQARALAGQE